VPAAARGRGVDGVVTHRWVYKDALNPVAELDSMGNVVAVFVYGTKAHVPELMMKNGKTYRLITDHVGSVRMVVNTADGTIVQRIDYNSFGEVLSDSNPGIQPFGFQGGLYDPATGLTRFGARDYDPTTGRWLSKDPIGMSGGLNQYVFCGNNPVMFVDPWGLWGVQFGENGFNIGVGHPTMVFTPDSWMEVSKGAASTLDGIIPFVDPLEIAYADANGDITQIYRICRFLGSASRTIYLGTLNARVAGQILSTSGQSLESIPVLDRMLFNQVWLGQLVSETAPAWASTAFGAANAVVNIGSTVDTWREIQGLTSSNSECGK